MAFWDGYTTSALQFGLILIVFLIVLGITVGIALYINYQRRYKQYKVMILKTDGFGNPCIGWDDAGVFIDRKTNNKRLFLKRNNVGLNPDIIPYLNAGKIKLIVLKQTGLKNFHYISFPEIVPKVTLKVGEEDVNWAINAYERSKKMFMTDIWAQLIPYFVLAFVSIIILVMFIYFFKDFGVLKEMSVQLSDTARSLKDVAMIGKNYTVVMQ